MSVLSLFFAILSFVFYFFGELFLAGSSIIINSLLDALDGEVARKKRVDNLKGDFVDHIIDRYADVFIIFGVAISPHAPTSLGALAIAGVLLTSYLGTQAQALGVGRVYSGILGRANRLILIIVFTFATTIYKDPVVWDLTFLGFLLVMLATLGFATSIQRSIQVWRALKHE